MSVLSTLRGLRRRRSRNTIDNGLTSGELGPQDYRVEIGTMRNGEFQEGTPWRDLRTLIDFLEGQGRRLRLRLFKKIPHRTSVEPTFSAIPQSATSSTRNKKQNDQEQALGVAQTKDEEDTEMQGMPHGSARPKTEAESIVTKDSGKISNSALVTEKDTKGKKPIAVESRKEPVRALGPTFQNGAGRSIEAEGDNNDASTIESVSGYASRSINFSLRVDDEDAPFLAYTPPRTHAGSSPWTMSAAMVKVGKELWRAEQILYDTGSFVNWISEPFMESCGFIPRLILPDDLKLYETVRGPVIPKYYVEVELRDDKYKTGLNKIVCILQSTVGGCGLILGSGFMGDHGVVLEPHPGHGAYVTTAGKVTATVKKEQQKLIDKTEEERQEYKRILESTTGTAAMPSGTSQREQAENSSRTSTSSCNHPEEPAKSKEE